MNCCEKFAAAVEAEAVATAELHAEAGDGAAGLNQGP